MPYKLITAPAAEPVTLTEAKSHLRVDFTDDDTLITSLIIAARQHAETITQRALVTQTWKLTLDAFPGPTLMGVPPGTPFSLPPSAILLDKSPVTAITNFTYTAMDGSTQTLASGTDYVADFSSEPARLTPPFGKIWPVPLPQIGAVQVTFTAGFGADSTFIPEAIRRWMLIRVGTMYANREEVVVLNRGRAMELPYVDSLLDGYRVVRY